MGISGVYKEIGPGQRVALARLAAEHLEKTGTPLRVAIDISIWLFQVQSSKGGTNPPLRTFYYRLLRLLSLAIHPIFVFDGPHKPKFKRNKRVGTHTASIPEYMARKLCSFFSFSTHKAPGEAEAECALLQREGIVDVVWTEDVDALMFGSRQTIRNWSAEQKGKHPTHVNLYDSATIKAESGLDREGMILVALMSGGDYIVEGLPGCGPKVACEAARAGFGADLCSIGDNDTAVLNAWRTRLIDELRTNKNKVFKRKPRQFDVPDDFPNLEVLRFYTHPALSSSDQIRALKDGMRTIDEAIRSNQDMLALKNEWKSDKTQSKVYSSLRTLFELPVDIQGLRKFTADAFDWTTISGAKHFIRSLAPALLVRELRLKRASRQDSCLISNITSTRTHITTGNLPELRLEYVPLNVVPLDLDAEDPEQETVGSNSTIATSADRDQNDEALDEEDEERTTRTATDFDPSKPTKAWIVETIVRTGVPDVVSSWNLRQQEKAARAARKQAGPRRGLSRSASALATLESGSSITADLADSIASRPTIPSKPTRKKKDAPKVTLVERNPFGITADIPVLDLSGKAATLSNSGTGPIPTNVASNSHKGKGSKANTKTSRTIPDDKIPGHAKQSERELAKAPQRQSRTALSRAPSFKAPILELPERESMPTVQDIHFDSSLPSISTPLGTLENILRTPFSNKADLSTPKSFRTSRSSFRRTETAPSVLETPRRPGTFQHEIDLDCSEELEPLEDILGSSLVRNRSDMESPNRRTGVSPEKKKHKNTLDDDCENHEFQNFNVSTSLDAPFKGDKPTNKPSSVFTSRPKDWGFDRDTLFDLSEVPEESPIRQKKVCDIVLDSCEKPTMYGAYSPSRTATFDDFQLNNESDFLDGFGLEDTLGLEDEGARAAAPAHKRPADNEEQNASQSRLFSSQSLLPTPPPQLGPTADEPSADQVPQPSGGTPTLNASADSLHNTYSSPPESPICLQSSSKSAVEPVTLLLSEDESDGDPPVLGSTQKASLSTSNPGTATRPFIKEAKQPLKKLPVAASSNRRTDPPTVSPTKANREKLVGDGYSAGQATHPQPREAVPTKHPVFKFIELHPGDSDWSWSWSAVGAARGENTSSGGVRYIPAPYIVDISDRSSG